jgi:CRP-like cAMP-binding protein
LTAYRGFGPVDGRLLVLFWHLADRFGRVDGDAVVVPLALSHGTLAELVAARRPSVSKALQDLAARDLLTREPGDRWVLRSRGALHPMSTSTARARR